MHVVLLHLSDIHIRFQDDRILDKAARIAAVINEIPEEINLCVVVLTGDLVFSGKTHEYELLKQFIADLKTSLAANRKIRQHGIVMVPGNHDCDFSLDQDLRRIVLKSIAEDPNKVHDASIVNLCTTVQAPYFSTMAQIENRASEIGMGQLVYTRSFSLPNNSNLHFHCFNTAWISRQQEQQAELSFPPQLASKPQKQGDISVAMFHHPLRWLQAENARKFETHIESISDFVLIGHEHVVGQFQKSRPSGQANEYYEGGALHTGQVPFSSEFNVIILNVIERIHSSITYSWNSGRYQRIAHTEGRQFALSPERYAGFKFTAKFTDELLDLGAQFTHPAKKNLTIDDVYIYPDLRESKPVAERAGRVEITRSKPLGKELVKRGKVVVFGDDSSGKTCLARAWTQALLQQGVVPILISATEWPAFTTAAALMTIVEARCSALYGSIKCAEFSQLDAKDKVILVDDCHRSEWYRSHRREVLEVLERNFGTIILFGDQLMRLNDITYGRADGNNPLLQYHKFDLLPFGHELRRSLAEKWVRVGREAEEDGPSLTRRVHEATKALTGVTGKNLVPSHPIFLLVILQQMEALLSTSSSAAASEASPSHGYGAYGYFFDALITRALAHGQEKGFDLDTGFKYLAELAYTMYSQEVRRLSRSELRQQHEKYCREYRLTLEFDSIIGFLMRSHVLRCESEQFDFKYPYQYHYFVARALRDDSERLGIGLPELIRTVYTDESTGVMMFLVHLSRDERIIPSVLKHAQSLYAEVEQCDFREDVTFLRELSQTSNRLRLPATSAKENHITLMQETDRRSTSALGLPFVEEGLEMQTEAQHEGNVDKVVNDILQLNVAFKTIQILGQIIKNFAGSTKGTVKLEIVRQSYSLGLRALNRLLRIIFDNQGPLKADIENWLRIRGVNPTEVGGRASGLVGWICEGLTLTFIIKTAEAVGLPKLAQTYDDIAESDASVGVRMIDLAVRLEHLPGFPENPLKALAKDVHNHPFSKSILKKIVYRYFYLYDTSHRLRQRICALLDITVPMRGERKKMQKGGGA